MECLFADDDLLQTVVLHALMYNCRRGADNWGQENFFTAHIWHLRLNPAALLSESFRLSPNR